MRSFASLPFVAGLVAALPQDGCSTVTTELVVPTTTATYTTTQVVTEHPTTAKDLGTFTYVTTISSTKTLTTVTSTACPIAGSSVHSPPPYTKRALGLHARGDACTVTVTSTTSYGQTATFVAASGKTSTFYDYTDFTQATVTSTNYHGTAYAIATAATTATSECASPTLDARCSPSALISAYDGFGLEYLSDTPTSGAAYATNATDASSCCQLCAESSKCAASAWDSRTGSCKLEFPVDPLSGDLNCGEGLLAYYDAGPVSPMSPGTGWYVAPLCGNVEFGSAKPDDGT